MKVKLPKFVRYILKTVADSGHTIYIVGGVTRDILMKRESNDWDFTTDATPEIITALFENSFYDNKFGTVGIINLGDKQNEFIKPEVFEITTFRKDIGYSDRRHPDKIEWGKSLEDDLIRRDFTMNAIAFKPNPVNQPLNKEYWELEIIDPYNGQNDIQNNIIRAVGNPDERFREDALRMMRAVRFSTQLGFTIEPKTFQAIQKKINLIEKISGERIRDELLKLLSYPQAANGYRLLHESGLAKKILPEVEQGYGVEQKSPGRHHIYDVWTHSIMSLQFCPSKDPIVRLAVLIHDIGKPLTVNKEQNGTITFYNHEIVGEYLAKNIARRLRLSRNEQDRLVKLVRWHQFSVDERQTDKAIRRFIRNVGLENLADILTVRTADRLGGGARETSWRLESFKNKLVEVQKQPFSVTDLKINGNEVMKILNIKPGPMIGEILNQLFEEVEENQELNTEKYLENRIKKFIQTKQ